MQGMKVLIVEDDGDLRGLYCFLLSSEGYQVKAVRNGLQAIAEIQANRPDIVVTDIAMPVFSGLELIRAIRAHHDLADLPILAVTAFSENFREHALEAGADDAIEKPTDIEELCGAILRIASGAQRQTTPSE